jgi:hypothetical protein
LIWKLGHNQPLAKLKKQRSFSHARSINDYLGWIRSVMHTTLSCPPMLISVLYVQYNWTKRQRCLGTKGFWGHHCVTYIACCHYFVHMLQTVGEILGTVESATEETEARLAAAFAVCTLWVYQAPNKTQLPCQPRYLASLVLHSHVILFDHLVSNFI